ncbi:unnamed protein product [Paramecium pentaurelia]|uniref:Uncharacterized protein n=1 Tax=Paramecium pentaurelia TaxID=43138 RepID=A0A8S1XZY8_9CILI|nr:unnamed protein product [Paramecium pentaurelia]
MRTSSFIDFADALLSCCCGIVDIKRLDNNISIGMFCRILFFLFTILLRDLSTYTWTEFISQIVAWFIFHLFIIIYEIPYFLDGHSESDKREHRYKYMDIIQLLIGIIYFTQTEWTYLEFLTFILFLLNLLINLLGLCKSYCVNKKKQDYYEQGGVKQIILGLFVGTLSVTIYLFIIRAQYEEEIEASGSLGQYMTYTIIGEIGAAVSSLFFLFIPMDKYNFTSDCTKGVLGFFYGINFGLFSIFYGFLFGIILIIIFFILIITVCSQHTDSQVHPA